MSHKRRRSGLYGLSGRWASWGPVCICHLCTIGGMLSNSGLELNVVGCQSEITASRIVQ